MTVNLVVSASSITLLKNANVYAPQALGLKHLVIGGGEILYMGDALPVLDPLLAVDELDLQGQALLPGFIDGHTHITGGGGEAGFATRVPAVLLSQFTQAGVTTAVGLLGTDDVTRSTESLLAQVYALREEGLSAYCYTGGYHLPPTTLTGSIRSDIVFIEPIVGVGELAISDHRSSQPTLNELLKVASEAHVSRLMTGKAGIVHLHLGDGERG
jgi:beta-aspartyl-dipeptidase (metallo-type)